MLDDDDGDDDDDDGEAKDEKMLENFRKKVPGANEQISVLYRQLVEQAMHA